MGKRENLEDIIRKAVEAGRISAERSSRDAFKETERRLHALPTLRRKLEDDKERLNEFLQYGPKERSKSVTRFVKNGVRLTPDEIFHAVLTDMKAMIAADEYEVNTMERALQTIATDEYYQAVSGRYLEDISDDVIAARIPCDTTTVWRNRRRLVQRLAVWLYGASAI